MEFETTDNDAQPLTIGDATAIAEGIEAFFLMTNDPGLSREEALQKAKQRTEKREFERRSTELSD